jgi:DNA-binding NarL/FixJ family response regulator
MKTGELNQEGVISILIVDDHHLLRHGLRAMLQSFKKELVFEISEAESGEKALQWLGGHDVAIIMMDYKLEGMNGAETVTRILRFKPGIKILALSNYNEYPVISAMMDAGAMGYVLKSVEPAQLLTAIRTVLQGRKYYCNEAALTVIAATEETEASKKLAMYKISARELEVLILIGQGLTNAEIAARLFVNRRTVDTHRQNLLKKMRVKNTAALIRLAAEFNLLK